ncbi:MAG TPA: hypothetical protein DD473_04090 [Planctomycetaceae bacterium]|nr:hypothetical protein [Planctomycetaceae bacterium]
MVTRVSQRATCLRLHNHRELNSWLLKRIGASEELRTKSRSSYELLLQSGPHRMDRKRSLG